MTTIKLNDLKRLPIDHDREHKVLREVHESGYYVHGPQHAAFEQEFAAWCGVSHAVGVASGTDALELALRALGVSPGDRVATVANAGGYTTCAILAIGAVPVYVDIDKSLTMCPHHLQALLRTTPEIHTVVITHLYGRLACMPELIPSIRAAGCRLLEDCAQAHGASDGQTKAGAFGDAAAFSFYPTKNLGAIGDAGAVVTSHADVLERLRLLRQYGWRTRYTCELPDGRNSRLDELQAAVLRVRLPMVDRWNLRRRHILQQYRRHSHGTALVFPGSDGDDCVAHLAVAQHPRRQQFQAALERQGVETAIHYPLLDTRQPAWQTRIPPTTLPVSEAATENIVTLPCHPGMTDFEIETVCRAIAAADSGC
jgi:dTDP-4-amino-4,6-dideoxygalactose transaminase